MVSLRSLVGARQSQRIFLSRWSEDTAGKPACRWSADSATTSGFRVCFAENVSDRTCSLSCVAEFRQRVPGARTSKIWPTPTDPVSRVLEAPFASPCKFSATDRIHSSLSYFWVSSPFPSLQSHSMVNTTAPSNGQALPESNGHSNGNGHSAPVLEQREPLDMSHHISRDAAARSANMLKVSLSFA